MIGSGLKKLAVENGMTIYSGVAYGNLRGFAATLSEGAAYQKVDFAVTFPDPAGREALKARIGESSVRSKYLVQNISFGTRSVQVTFRDSLRPMKHIRAFLDFFLPLLEEFGATRADTCAECGEPVIGGAWAQINGICYHMHEACAEEVRVVMGADKEQPREDAGSYLTGTLGALAGAALGAVVWALVLNAGYMAAIVGLCIGWLAEWGYNLGKGKQGMGKIWILVTVILLAVIFGTLGSDAIEIAMMMRNGYLPGFGYHEIPMFILAMLVGDGEYRLGLIGDLVMGLIFATLGALTVLGQTARKAPVSKFRFMK